MHRPRWSVSLPPALGIKDPIDMRRTDRWGRTWSRVGNGGMQCAVCPALPMMKQMVGWMNEWIDLMHRQMHTGRQMHTVDRSICYMKSIDMLL